MSRPPQPSICLPNKAVNNSGLTLIECLVAIAVIGLTAAVMAPVMVFSMATRVQSQRAEQALQIAQGEIDQIRLMAERGGDFSSALAAYPITSSASVAITNPPTAAPTYGLNSTTTNTAKKVDIGNGTTNQIQSPYGPLSLLYKSAANFHKFSRIKLGRQFSLMIF